MAKITFTIMLAIVCLVASMPLEKSEDNVIAHNIQKRFINPALASGSFDDSHLSKMRTKRSEDDCQKLQLCKLHARSNRNFFSAFELYFVNKENAKLWDHQARSMAECEQRFDCYDR